MAWEVRILPDAASFLEGLSDEEFAMFEAAFEQLKEHGSSLGAPIVKRIKSSRHHNMKELRRQKRGRIFRLLFAFDLERRAVMLVGGDKAEEGFDDFYEKSVPKADDIFDEYLSEVKKQKAAKHAAQKKRAGKSDRKRGGGR